MGYTPRGHKESDIYIHTYIKESNMTEQLSVYIYT